MGVYKKLLLTLIVACQWCFACGKVQPSKYGAPPLPDSITLKAGTQAMMDSIFASNQLLAQRTVVYATATPHQMVNRTTDFYVLLFLCFMLGLIRTADTRYFNMLWQAFWNPTLSNRQLKEQLQGAGLPNLLMNILFAMVGGTYIYYIVTVFFPQPHSHMPPSLLILIMTGSVAVIYTAKYAMISFSGWAFRVESVTEHYLFNVFLINKILAIVLVPFVIILAFADPIWSQPVLVVSIVVVLILIINRYIRSWQAFGSFFQYSKFHFFTYLCASELLPLAVLMKLLVRGLLIF